MGTRADVRRQCTNCARDRPQGHVRPQLHQNSPTGVRMLTEAQFQAIKPVRYERRVTDGQGLYLLVTPKGALHWGFPYRFAGKCKTLALGSYPVVTLDWARSRHKSFRDLRPWNRFLGAKERPRKAPPPPKDAGVGGRTGSHARRHLSLPAVRREQVVVCSSAIRSALLFSCFAAAISDQRISVLSRAQRRRAARFRVGHSSVALGKLARRR